MIFIVTTAKINIIYEKNENEENKSLNIAIVTIFFVYLHNIINGGA